MNRRQKIIVSIRGIFIVLLALVGLTYAYFLTQIKGNENDKSISVTTANLILEYTDGNGILEPSGKIVPGNDIKFLDSDGNEQALKPMNCPNSIKIYQTKLRSYKDLPLRFNDVDVIHRNEKSGQLNGMLRVRMFHQDDSHNFVTQVRSKKNFKHTHNLFTSTF